MRLGIKVSAPGNFDGARRRIVGGAVAAVREMAADVAELARPNVPKRTGRLQATVDASDLRDGAVVSAGRGHRGMANRNVRDRTRAAIGKAARKRIDKGL